MTALVLSFVLAQATPTFLGPYTRLGSQDESAFLDAGATFRGSLVYGTDGGAAYLYDGVYWQGVQTATTAPMNLYVDIDGGSDYSSCTGGDGGSCLTLAGALKKVPRFINHNVTLNIAAGTYAEKPTFGDKLYIQDGATFSTVGVLTTFTPATGTSSGSVTASVAGSAATGPTTVTDGAQTWTVDNLKGKWITFTSGAQNGNSFPIVSNTATTVVIPSTTAIVVGVTYRVDQQGTVFASTGAAKTVVSGGGTFSLKNVAIQGGQYPNIVAGNTTTVSLTQVAVTGGATGLIATYGTRNLTRVYVGSTGGGTGNTGTNLSSAGSVQVSDSWLAHSTGRALNVGEGTSPFIGGTVIQTGNANTTAYSLNGYSASGSSAFITCTSGTGTVGLVQTAASQFYILRVVGCGTGVQVDSRGDLSASTVVASTFSFDTTTTAVSAQTGGQVNFRGYTPTFTTVTNELSIDGTVYPFSFLTGLPSPQVITSPYGSTLIR